MTYKRRCETCLHYREPAEIDLKTAQICEDTSKRFNEDRKPELAYKYELRAEALRSSLCTYDFDHRPTKNTHVCHRWAEADQGVTV